jgi:hypothetical protein
VEYPVVSVETGSEPVFFGSWDPRAIGASWRSARGLTAGVEAPHIPSIYQRVISAQRSELGWATTRGDGPGRVLNAAGWFPAHQELSG